MTHPRLPSAICTVVICLSLGCAQKPAPSTLHPPGTTSPPPSQQAGTTTGASAPACPVCSHTEFSLDPEDVTTLTESTLIGEGTHGSVVVKGRNTEVTVAGGTIHQLIVREAGRTLITAGTIKTLFLYNDCIAVVAGGHIGTVSGYEESRVILKGKGHIDAVESHGPTKIIVDSQGAGIDTVKYVTKCGCVTQSQKTQLDLSCGRFKRIGTGPAEVSVLINGLDLDKSAFGGEHGYGQVQGQWKNGQTFSISFLDKSTFGHILLNEL